MSGSASRSSGSEERDKGGKGQDVLLAVFQFARIEHFELFHIGSEDGHGSSKGNRIEALNRRRGGSDSGDSGGG